MKNILRSLACASGWCLLLAAAPVAHGAEPVDFSRDVRPILSKNCFKCHGPDDEQRQGGLRLDLREAAIGEADSGLTAIAPGKPEESELLRRVLSGEEFEQMPPPSSKLVLSDAERETLRRWIAEGAEYKPHWSFQAPVRPELPPVSNHERAQNAIDRFVLARLEAEGLSPSPPADRLTLARRVYLDLIGLPPTPEEADAFANDPSPDAYEKLVDKLLASPHYGERFARRWLDLARYADTNGYEKDRQRSIWPYRDWVINALNRDLPFDQFSIEQLAGDMLPNATPEQRVATGFHRNTMLNEEGGIDPLEFRFYAMTDRVSTTATVWLGLTLGCAQCHTHKYDPLTHREYYQFMAFLNNADELTIPSPSEAVSQRLADFDRQIAAAESQLASQFPAEGETRWHEARPISLTAESGAKAELLPDGSYRLSGDTAEKDVYTLVVECDAPSISSLKIEALADPALPSKGPGRTTHGNFVLSEIAASASLATDGSSPVDLKFASATADFSQDGFPPANALDGKADTGWAIHGPDPWNVDRAVTFQLASPVSFAGPSRWTIRLEQNYGGQHLLGRLRVRLGEALNDQRPLEERRAANLARRFEQWTNDMAAKAAHWRVLSPTQMSATLSRMELQSDGSIFVSGDMTKRDVYELKFQNELEGATALRLEVLPDDRLPQRGPGRIYYEGPFGDFFLSEMTVSSAGGPVAFKDVTQSFAAGESKAAKAVDNDPLTGWSIDGGQGRDHVAVFPLEKPLAAGEVNMQMVFERYYAASLGRFRLSVTSDAKPIAATGLPADVEESLLLPAGERTSEQTARLMHEFLATAPELASARAEIDKLRKERKQLEPTTLVFQERPADHPRSTFIHKRGEFLQPTEEVSAETLSILHSLPDGVNRDRLAFAKWLVDDDNPLVGRVTVNRHWAAFFGRGLVRTTEDFGFQGELPTHPRLLDWLATEFAGPSSESEPTSWSLKRLHRLIVTSATYQQSSRVTPELADRDPENKLLARGPRHRIEAELVRDAALAMSGLLSTKLGGKSVFPSQPPAVTSDGAYGSLNWTTSPGGDRYRRGLYTFSKRTAPFAMFATFDAPSGEACVPRRELSNTPLQALTLLNDQAFIETAQALGAEMARQASAGEEADREATLTELFRRILVRRPTIEELLLLSEFYNQQRARLEAKEIDAAAIAGEGDNRLIDRATWTIVARALLNLDETFAKD